MNVGQGQASRPDFRDRNADIVVEAFAGEELAPHSATVRDQYTVPADKKAQLTALFAKLEVVSAPSTIERRAIFVQTTPSGGSNTTLFYPSLDQGESALGANRQVALGTGPMFDAADLFRVQTLDDSTGGTVTYRIGFALNEYDA